MNDLVKLALQVNEKLKSEHLMLATAESCTGGWIAQALTSVAGSSECFERGFVTYSDNAKQEMLGVKKNTITTFGAVSEHVAEAMARGALRHSHADISIAVTGVAGPGGGSLTKPVGTVWFGFARKHGSVVTIKRRFYGPRETVRKQSVLFALDFLLRDILSQ